LWHLMAYSSAQPEIAARNDAGAMLLPYPASIVEFEATAYCDQGVTKSGLPTAPGIVAGDPSVLPLGSVIHVEAGPYQGLFRVLDTGRLVKGRIIDIFIPDLNEALKFGRQKVKVTVLRYGYGRSQDLFPAD